MVQIVGDSSPFSLDGTKFAEAFLLQELKSAAIIEYGYTGYDVNGRLDVNGLVNKFIESNPEAGQKTLANIVDQSFYAIKNWGVKGSPLVRNFLYVFKAILANIVSGTRFGDDVLASDMILLPDLGDYLVCLEGGVQSFLQVINSLERSVPVKILRNLREENRKGFFSAADFLWQMRDLPGNLSDLEIEKHISTYLNSIEAIWDVTRPDHESKKALFERAMKRFLDLKLFLKINDLIAFYEFKIPSKSNL